MPSNALEVDDFFSFLGSYVWEDTEILTQLIFWVSICKNDRIAAIKSSGFVECYPSIANIKIVICITRSLRTSICI